MERLFGNIFNAVLYLTYSFLPDTDRIPSPIPLCLNQFFYFNVQVSYGGPGGRGGICC